MIVEVSAGYAARFFCQMNSLYPGSIYYLFIGDNINELIAKYGMLVYVIMFAIIFCETGLVVAPFLPGDSMIFTAAALSAQTRSVLNVHLIAAAMTVAAFSGDMVNYFIGRYIGPKIYRKDYTWISRKRLNRTKAFFKKYGVRTIIYARFIPVVRTFAPFLAGVSEMRYRRFVTYNFIGGFTWVILYSYGGYFFGNIPFVKAHLQITILITFGLTLIPAIYSLLRVRHVVKRRRRR